MNKKIGLPEIKEALKDGRFRDKLPVELNEMVIKFLHNPGCGCNLPLYKKLIKEHSNLLLEYYPESEIGEIIDVSTRLELNHWTVINCPINELEQRLSKLPMGRKQVAVTRFEDQVTCVINSLD